jgi:hypothetical protein
MINVEVCLGPDPGQQKPPEPPKVRHRARGLLTLAIRARQYPVPFCRTRLCRFLNDADCSYETDQAVPKGS